jgi:hypothetical protein
MFQRAGLVATASFTTKLSKTKKALELGVRSGKTLWMAGITVMLGNLKKKKELSLTS